MHQCYYCEQLFDSKEELYEHVEVHSDVERNREIMDQKKRKNDRDKNSKLNKNRVKVRINQI